MLICILVGLNEVACCITSCQVNACFLTSSDITEHIWGFFVVFFLHKPEEELFPSVQQQSV